ncbi:MAG TPA: ATP-binding cassette domain-containing protein [Candidatus Faecaligallichristensenella faecipullorum]|nr:ATP-binding cassette domain-containing protein [Candidatus Faecaligallichristensenella faecipullorum]
MIKTVNVSLQFGKRILFENVNIQFDDGNCYGIIGANGAGKSQFLKILSGELQPNKGEVIIPPGKRLAVLKQDHFAYDEYSVMDTVIMGHKRLYEVMKEKDALYMKPDFSDEDGLKAAELEGEFAELDGWEAEANAASLLSHLGIPEAQHSMMMRELEANDKVKVLLAQALFGNPDILLLDEPTNHLDAKSIAWLERFLGDFENTVIVVSHDRHFLNEVCTYVADIDYKKITLYAGNYDFWYESSQLALRQQREANKRSEAKIKELQDFIQRFSANASKSKQATSRKKLLEKIVIEDIKPSSRKYPFIEFKPEREAGNDLLVIEGISKTIDGVKVLDNFSMRLEKGDKVAFVGEENLAKTTLFQILMGEIEPDEGSFKWGVTITPAYFPKDNNRYFDGVELNLVDWLRQYSKEKDETFVRGFLGRMLFTGEESQKMAKVLSGGERVRCMLSRMMLSGANFLLLDEPTNHLDLESITSLNNGLINFPGTLMLISQDHQLVETVANRIVEISPEGVFDKRVDYNTYLEMKGVQ